MKVSQILAFSWGSCPECLKGSPRILYCTITLHEICLVNSLPDLFCSSSLGICWYVSTRLSQEKGSAFLWVSSILRDLFSVTPHQRGGALPKERPSGFSCLQFSLECEAAYCLLVFNFESQFPNPSRQERYHWLSYYYMYTRIS